jgi:diadenosine tetraphosphate (Ap4A) HIT family hydrolase
MTDCPFCHPNWDKLDIVDRTPGGSIAVVKPIDPVTEGHVLIIHANHADSAAHATGQAAGLMEFAAKYVKRLGVDANIITSIGPDATQTVMHTHLHVVPRRAGDGLALPWTGQKKTRKQPKPKKPADVVDQDKSLISQAVRAERLARAAETISAERDYASKATDDAGPTVSEELDKLQAEIDRTAENDAARKLNVRVHT